MTVRGWENWASRWEDRPALKGAGVTVDVHSHVKIPRAARVAMPHFSPEFDPRTLFSSEETRGLNAAYHQSVDDRFTDPGVRIGDMDTMGIDVQALSLAPPQYYYWLDSEIGPEVAAMQNDEIAALARTHPRRFRGIGTLPLAHPEAAVRELGRLHGDLGLRGVEIGTDVVGTDLDDPMLEPVWEALEELEVVVILHPAGFTDAGRLTDYYLVNVIGLPLSSTIAVTRLVLAGVFERHPLLKMVVVHGGGYLPFYSSRTDHAFRHRPEMRRHISRLPSEYLSGLWFDSTVFDPGLLERLVQEYGADKVLLGTDYPFDMGQGNPIDFVGSARLTTRERAMILGENADRLFGFRLGAAEGAAAPSGE